MVDYEKEIQYTAPAGSVVRAERLCRLNEGPYPHVLRVYHSRIEVIRYANDNGLVSMENDYGRTVDAHVENVPVKHTVYVNFYRYEDGRIHVGNSHDSPEDARRCAGSRGIADTQCIAVAVPVEFTEGQGL